jgi:hypothetical protein
MRTLEKPVGMPPPGRRNKPEAPGPKGQEQQAKSKSSEQVQTADSHGRVPQLLPQSKPNFEAFYDDNTKDFWVKDSRGHYMRVNEIALRRMLKSVGFRTERGTDEPLSEVDEELRLIQVDKRIFYAGPLAGYNTGTYEIEGKLILVTDSPKVIPPVEGEFPVLEQMIANMLGNQLPYLLGWLHYALKNLHAGQRHPGQALVLAGERECGKSLLQQVITELLGGRSAKPYQFMTEATTFNAELFGAEHLMIEDEAASTDLRARRKFGAYLKQITAAESQRHHGKNRTALTLHPFWRLSISVNDEPENLMVLPPLDDSLGDKLILLHAAKHPMPMPTSTPSEKAAFWETIRNELPAFVQFLLDFEIPESLRSSRFGITHFHHPLILEAIEEMAPETILLEYIEQYLFNAESYRDKWEGSAGEFEQELRRWIPDRQIDKVLSFRSAAGTYLARLATKMPKRISCRRIHGKRLWLIKDTPTELATEPLRQIPLMPPRPISCRRLPDDGCEGPADDASEEPF